MPAKRESGPPQPVTDRPRVEVEIQLDKLHTLAVERAPRLAARQPAQHSFQIAFVGEFKDEGPAGSERGEDLAQRERRIDQVVQGADHRRRVEGCGAEREPVGVAGDVSKALSVPQPTARLFELRQRIVEQYNALKAAIAGRVPPCAGADLQYMQKLSAADHATNLEDARRLGELFSAVSDCPKPVIAQVHGAAIGGGVGLVAASDFVVAAEGTKFGFTETRLGIVPGVISPFALRRLGPAVCRRLFLTAEIFDAHRALEIGLVDHCVTADDLESTTASIVDRLREAGPNAQAAAKRLLDEIGNLPLEDAVAQAPEHIALQRATREAREGFAAFLEKRRPAWARPEE